MYNLLSDICVKTKRLARIHEQVAVLQAEANALTVDLAMLGAQCYELRSNEITNKPNSKE